MSWGTLTSQISLSVNSHSFPVMRFTSHRRDKLRFAINLEYFIAANNNDYYLEAELITSV